jgi:hypothetical protein
MTKYSSLPFNDRISVFTDRITLDGDGINYDSALKIKKVYTDDKTITGDGTAAKPLMAKSGGGGDDVIIKEGHKLEFETNADTEYPNFRIENLDDTLTISHYTGSETYSGIFHLNPKIDESPAYVYVDGDIYAGDVKGVSIEINGKTSSQNYHLKTKEFEELGNKYECLTVFYEIGGTETAIAYFVEPDATGKTIFHVNGSVRADNVQGNVLNSTNVHETTISTLDSGTEDSQTVFIGRFCETTGEINDLNVSITSCIPKIQVATELNNKIIGIVVSKTTFATQGDVLVCLDDGVNCTLGDLLVPTLTGARVATEEEKSTIVFNGLPRVRVMVVENVPKKNDKNCVACFIA